MSDIKVLIDYFKKLQKVINYEAVLSVFGYALVKKTRIDDIKCCIIAKLPNSYKQLLELKVNVQKWNSVICYNLISKHLTNKFFLDKNLYLIKTVEINKLINSFLMTIEKDMNEIEKHYGNR